MPAIKTKAPCPVVHLCFQFAEGKNGNLHIQLSTTTRVYKLNSILEFLVTWTICQIATAIALAELRFPVLASRGIKATEFPPAIVCEN